MTSNISLVKKKKGNNQLRKEKSILTAIYILYKIKFKKLCPEMRVRNLNKI